MSEFRPSLEAPSIGAPSPEAPVQGTVRPPTAAASVFPTHRELAQFLGESQGCQPSPLRGPPLFCAQGYEPSFRLRTFFSFPLPGAAPTFR